MLHIGPKVSAITRHTPETFTALWGFPPALLAHYKALAGDLTDNIKGVEGVGPTYAKKLLIQFPGGIEAIYAGIEQVTAKALKARLVAGEDEARRCLTLATLDTAAWTRFENGCFDPFEALAMWGHRINTFA
jgi:DNA polymerase-1